MITTFQVLHDMIDTDCKIFFERTTSARRGHNLKLFTFASSSSLRKNYFSNRVINEWNNLPATIVSAKSVVEFEKLYDYYHYIIIIKDCNFRLAVINVCPVLVPSELLLSTRLPT